MAKPLANGCFFSVVAINLLGVLLGPLLAFGTAMSAFSPRSNARGVGDQLASLTVLGWMWNPAAMFVHQVLGANSSVAFFAAITWAILVGYVAGRLFAPSKPTSPTPEGAEM